MTTASDNRVGDRFARQLGIYNPENRNDEATFIGVGGIGSFAAFGAAKLGVPRITVIDPDTVEEHNVPNQFYDGSQPGESKVEAIASYIHAHGLEPHVETHMVELPHPDVTLNGLVISGLDSMKARASIWEESIKLNPRVTRYIDARLSGEFIAIYTVNPSNMDDIKGYEQTLHSDEEGEEVSCTERGIIDVGLQVGSLLTRSVRRHFNHEELKPMTLCNHHTLTTSQFDWMPSDG